MISREQINSVKQNKTRLIVDDVVNFLKTYEPGGAEVDEEKIREKIQEILLARGVYKWMAVRRDLIKFLDVLKSVEHLALISLIVKKGFAKGGVGGKKYAIYRHESRGFLKAVRVIKKSLRDMTRSARLRAPDNDRDAQALVSKIVMRGINEEKFHL